MSILWILVCDASRGRVFEIRHDDPEWHPVEVFENPDAHLKARDLAGDHSGQRSSEGASAHHNALAPHSSPKEVEQDHFVHKLAKMLDQAMRSKRFYQWVLVAPSHFLGRLKKELTPELQKHLLATVNKDLNHLDARHLAERLSHAVGLPGDGSAETESETAVGGAGDTG